MQMTWRQPVMCSKSCGPSLMTGGSVFVTCIILGGILNIQKAGILQEKECFDNNFLLKKMKVLLQLHHLNR